VSTESRTIRPFAGLGVIDDILSSTCSLQVGPERLAPGMSIVLNHEGFLVREVVLELGQSDDVFDALQIGLSKHVGELEFGLDEVELVVIASSPYLKIADVIIRERLDHLSALGRRITLSDPRPRALRTPRSGCQLDVYLLLGRAVEPRPLRPWRKGTWLAHCTFNIASELAPVGFSPRPLTRERRELDGLSPETVRLVVFENDDSPLEPGTDENSLALYVDEDVLAKLSVSSNTPASELFQMQLFLDAVAAILHAARADERFPSISLDDLDDSLFGRVLDGLSRRPGQTLEQRRQTSDILLQHARTRPDLFIAHAEAVTGMRKKLNEALDQ
jgi:hypothetical protein